MPEVAASITNLASTGAGGKGCIVLRVYDLGAARVRAEEASF